MKRKDGVFMSVVKESEIILKRMNFRKGFELIRDLKVSIYLSEAGQFNTIIFS